MLSTCVVVLCMPGVFGQKFPPMVPVALFVFPPTVNPTGTSTSLPVSVDVLPAINVTGISSLTLRGRARSVAAVLAFLSDPAKMGGSGSSAVGFRVALTKSAAATAPLCPRCGPSSTPSLFPALPPPLEQLPLWSLDTSSSWEGEVTGGEPREGRFLSSHARSVFSRRNGVGLIDDAALRGLLVQSTVTWDFMYSSCPLLAPKAGSDPAVMDEGGRSSVSSVNDRVEQKYLMLLCLYLTPHRTKTSSLFIRGSDEAIIKPSDQRLKDTGSGFPKPVFVLSYALLEVRVCWGTYS